MSDLDKWATEYAEKNVPMTPHDPEVREALMDVARQSFSSGARLMREKCVERSREATLWHVSSLTEKIRTVGE